MSIEEFINNTNGNAYDMDGAYGVQCVDGIKKFVQDFKGESNFSCGNGWAYGLWVCYGGNGVEKYFNKHSLDEAKKGDWIIWNKGTKNAPYSHVGMFIENVDNRVRTYGQNQNGIKAFNYCNLEKDGILGVLRLKELEVVETNSNVLGTRGWIEEGDNSVFIGKVSKFMYKTFPAYTDVKALGNYYGPYIKASITEFQKRAKAEGNYNSTVDGCLGPLTLKALVHYGFKY